MPIYHTSGQIPRKRHIAFRRPDGGLYAEELMGHEGFTGTSSLLYHTHPPTTVKSALAIHIATTGLRMSLSARSSPTMSPT